MNTAAASVIIFSRSICSPRCRIFQELRSGLHRVLVSLKSDFWPDKRYSCQINLQAPSSSAHLKAECPGAWIPSREVPETKLLPHLPPLPALPCAPDCAFCQSKANTCNKYSFVVLRSLRSVILDFWLRCHRYILSAFPCERTRQRLRRKQEGSAGGSRKRMPSWQNFNHFQFSVLAPIWGRKDAGT